MGRQPSDYTVKQKVEQKVNLNTVLFGSIRGGSSSWGEKDERKISRLGIPNEPIGRGEGHRGSRTEGNAKKKRLLTKGNRRRTKWF